MAKFHISADGPMPCKATVRDCPVGGSHFDDYTEAAKAFESEMKIQHGYGLDGMSERDRFPIDEDTVGERITDHNHIKWLTDNANERSGGYPTPYLESEHSVVFKRVDDYYTEVAILDEDSTPIIASSFDLTQDREAVVERLAFVARTNTARFGDEVTTEEVAAAEKLYESFKAHGGDSEKSVNLIVRLQRFSRDHGDPAGYFELNKENEERTRRTGRRSYKPNADEREFALAVVNDARKS
jgi:hypothetical protein